VEYQFRSYRIAGIAMADFIREWRKQIVPLRRRFGFEVIGAWSSDEESRFVWVLAYDGPEGYAARDAEYYASEERKALDPDPARHVAETETLMVDAVGHDPEP
jgi:NIPSNAP